MVAFSVFEQEYGKEYVVTVSVVVVRLFVCFGVREGGGEEQDA